jgi:hypothetical protein
MAAVFAADVAPPASTASVPPAGSDESKVKLGDTRFKVESLLGEPESLTPVDRMRTRIVFKRCSIVFESSKVVSEPSKVVQLPVMRSDEELAKEIADKVKVAENRVAAAQPNPAQDLSRSNARIKALLPRFEAVVSRPGSPVIYVHKQFPTEKYGLMPSVLVDDQGSLGLATNYFGGAWLFHDSVGVRIADKNHASSILPHGKPQRRVVKAGFIEERCVFDSQVDQQLVRDISTAKGKRVFISLLKEGGSILGVLTEQQFASFPPIVELAPIEMAAVRDSVDLADAFAAVFEAKAAQKSAAQVEEGAKKAIDKGL